MRRAEIEEEEQRLAETTAVLVATVQAVKDENTSQQKPQISEWASFIDESEDLAQGESDADSDGFLGNTDTAWGGFESRRGRGSFRRTPDSSRSNLNQVKSQPASPAGAHARGFALPKRKRDSDFSKPKEQYSTSDAKVGIRPRPPIVTPRAVASTSPKAAEIQDGSTEDDPEIRELMESRRKRLATDTEAVSAGTAAPRAQASPNAPQSAGSTRPEFFHTNQNKIQSMWSDFVDDDGGGSGNDDDDGALFSSAPPDGGSIFWG
eukprot:TRINITY_DN5281_c0_g1_i1.p1 TRINITY_DN5281_c0_g1~~TRINITY_DN5281_c0_g1_i1.p1  ORF type:complete len:264 (+),score=47.79 TRINITY_DN5281_c0_g1_i1:265-1056(+)